MGTRLGRFRTRLGYLPRTFSLVWGSARQWTVAWVALAAVEGVLPVATVYLTRSLVDDIVFATKHRGDGDELVRVLVVAGMLGAVMLISRLIRSAKTWAGEAQAELVREHISKLIHAKSAEADLAFYDSPEFYDHLHRAREEARYRPVLLLENLGSLLQNGITFIAMIAILIPYGLFLPLALLVSTVPALYFVLRSSERRHELARVTTAEERRSWYFDWLLTSGETAQELRLFGLANHFQKTFRGIREGLRTRKLQLAVRQTWSEIATGILSLVVLAVASLRVLLQTLTGKSSLGDLALFYQAFNQGLSLSQALLANVGQLYENTLFLGNLFEFLDFESQVKDPAKPRAVPNVVAREIRFRDVSFRYPGSERFALRNLDMKIASGEIVAIVGPNGSGKSTLLKLLCRFYDPESGTIEVDGTPLTEFSREQLRGRISVLFQTPMRYSDTARENIQYGRIGDDRLVEETAREAEAASIVERLPQSYDTRLGRWFSDGTELSVGEWQRLALARALYRDAPILILDEPTSAMDPWAELEWARKFREIAAGRTAIVVTHRFTTAMFTDRIFVMQDGQVREEGTHQELLERGGLYAAGWNSKEEVRR